MLSKLLSGNFSSCLLIPISVLQILSSWCSYSLIRIREKKNGKKNGRQMLCKYLLKIEISDCIIVYSCLIHLPQIPNPTSLTMTIVLAVNEMHQNIKEMHENHKLILKCLVFDTIKFLVSMFHEPHIVFSNHNFMYIYISNY